MGNHEYDFIAGAAHDLSGATEPYHPPWGNFGEESGGECGAMTARYVWEAPGQASMASSKGMPGTIGPSNCYIQAEA